ncbi:MAG: hypothetical protein IPN01_20640 [Deltaproteobacteria bacterium]|nr:hypothetical protein [Deltaproteobacteria bacterium]
MSLADGAGGLSAPTLWLDLGARARGFPELDRWPLYRELGDVNGDGATDLIWAERCDSSAQWFVAPSDGGRFVFEMDDEGRYPDPALGRLFWPLTKTLGEPDSSGYWVIRLGDISTPTTRRSAWTGAQTWSRSMCCRETWLRRTCTSRRAWTRPCPAS